MARLHFVKKARKDYPDSGIAKGDSYYWWKTRTTIGKSYHGTMHRSKERPPRSALVASEFYKTLYDIEDRLSDITAEGHGFDIDSIQSEAEEVASEMRQLGEEQREKFENMPEGLQQGDSGRTLESRADACENFADEIESFDWTLDLDDNASEEDRQAEVEGKVEELQQISYNE